MKKISLILFTSILLFGTLSCSRKDPFVPDYYHAGGYVILKESCKNNTDDDFWLVDLSFPLNTNYYGDTIEINGITYNHMIKTNQMPQVLKVVGKTVSFDFYISKTKLDTSHCQVNNPETYLLKEIDVVGSGEIK